MSATDNEPVTNLCRTCEYKDTYFCPINNLSKSATDNEPYQVECSRYKYSTEDF